MFKNILEHMNGIALYGIVSVCLFVTVFMAAILRAAFLRKNLSKSMGELPLYDGEIAPGSKGKSHE